MTSGEPERSALICQPGGRCTTFIWRVEVCATNFNRGQSSCGNLEGASPDAAALGGWADVFLMGERPSRPRGAVLVGPRAVADGSRRFRLIRFSPSVKKAVSLMRRPSW